MQFNRRQLLQRAAATAVVAKTGWGQAASSVNQVSEVLLARNQHAGMVLNWNAERPSLLPERQQISKKIPQGHPRIFFRPEDIVRLRSKLHESPFRECSESARAEADATLAKPMPKPYYPPDFYLPDGPSWHDRFSKSAQGMLEERAINRGQVERFIAPNAFAYLLTGDERYLNQARMAMNIVAGYDLTTTGYANTHGFNGVLPAMSLGLDYLWNDLKKSERDRCVAALLGRTREFYILANPQRDPLDNHDITYGPAGLLYAALSLYHHEPEAADWLWDVLVFMDRYWPCFGGDDGGWGNSIGYGEQNHTQSWMQMIFVAVGVNFFESSWGRNNGYQLFYFQPPYDHSTSFGDSSYNRPKGLQKNTLQTYAAILQNPYYQWYADQVKDEPLRGQDFALSRYLYWPQTPRAKAPTDLPQAIHLRDIGHVAMHSNLTDGTQNIFLQFKSSRFGSFSHNHADQNSFVLTAYESQLLIDSGYYPWYGSPHDMSWSRQTRAHNAILVNGKGQGDINLAASGRICHFVTSEDFDYVAGDATAAYQQPSPVRSRPELCAIQEDVRRMMRHIVFVRSAGCFVILDDLETERPAAFQFLLHALVRFEIDEHARAATLANGQAVLRAYALGQHPVEFSQTDQFSDPPETSVVAASQPGIEFPNQWHLTCKFTPTVARRQLLTAIIVRHRNDTSKWPKVERQDAGLTIGARVGDITVDFDLKSGAVSGRLPHSDGTVRWFEYSS